MALALFSLILGILALPFQAQAQSGWLDSSWSFRSAVTITNPNGTSLTNFQVHVVIASPFNFANAKSDGSDLRVTAGDGVTLLSFWIESWNAATSSASVWVNVPSISTSGATLYLYYGNPSATSASSGANTFDFFDDFSGGSVNTTKWTASGGTWSIVSDTRQDGTVGGVVRGSTSARQILASSYTGTDYVVQLYGKQRSGRIWGVVTRASSISNLYTANLYDDLNTTRNLYLYSWVNNTTQTSTATLGNAAVGTVNANTWYQLMVKVHSTNIDVYKDGVLQIHGVDTNLVSGRVALYGESGTVAEFSNVLIRKYAATEPTAAIAAAVATTTPEVMLSTASLTFAAQNQGTTSAAQTVTLSSAGPVGLLISNITTTGDFSQTNNCPLSPATLPSGSSCAVNVTFTPSATGTRSGSLVFTDSSPNTPQSVALSGTGLGPMVTISPQTATLNFTQMQQFTATVTGITNTAVNWYVDDIFAGSAAVGTISNTGLYTPPQAVGTHIVTAVSAANSLVTASVTVYVTNFNGIFTYHNDNLRTGQNSNETVLTPSNVNSTQFGKLFSLPVDGQIFAQPLYVPNVTVGQQVHNLLFVATQHDSVYAWDADTSASTPVWMTSFINPTAGVTTIPCAEAASGDCATIYPEYGITSTPVIDSSTGTLYVVAGTKEVSGTTTSYVYRLHALNIATGQEQFGGPVVIQATVPGGTGTISLNPKQHLQRPGLLLVNGVVYIGFGSHADSAPWYGWLLGYSASTLQQVMVFNTAPNGSEASIWQSGCAPAADANGNIYFITGNGTFDVNTGGIDYGDSIVKLNPNGTVADYFTPYDQSTLNTADNDLGSAGHVLLPDQPGTYPHLMIGAGKEGVIYVLNRDNMGKFNASSNLVVQSLPALTSGPTRGGLFGSPAYWNNYVYFVAWNDYLKAFQLNNGILTLSSTGPNQLAFPGATPTVSANGNSNGIVWIVQANVANDTVLSTVPAAVLRAYNATNVAVELYDSTQAGTRDTAGGAVKFAVPTVANGKVYVGNSNQVTVYGLLP